MPRFVAAAVPLTHPSMNTDGRRSGQPACAHVKPLQRSASGRLPKWVRAIRSASSHRRTISKRSIEQPEWLMYEPEQR